jgi:transposase
MSRVNCHQHGVAQMSVPWASGQSGFTALFERMVIALLLEMSITGVARHLRLSWDKVDGIMGACSDTTIGRYSNVPENLARSLPRYVCSIAHDQSR